MGRLADDIRRLIQERYVIGVHASERLEQRDIMEWQVVDAAINGRLVAERPNARPNAVVEIRGLLPDGVEVTTVWSLLRRSGVAKLVTVYYAE